ncbi:hemerythrin domain-containing protein [Desulfomicrobium baculatum]|uniref:Hemerythrin HHE cation binding domain protein n=1 Tax=Desulfomicrobium baculatum (strain DSM 4028 / VKM B-1378 / X) TaxID=525897 RepID=C7LRF4_DESBD|nr:hemerythrin domain-containing protein [Desulfomicrobium baculatum]ACU89300.1 Hemerythrin HHE cation binding domain protein [Desulfomicrobium baculatum DSM 4028]
MHATKELILEHQDIELMLEILKTVSTRLLDGGAVPPEHLEGILEFLTVFVDKCHHGKEEKYLFRAMEAAGVDHITGHIGVLIYEHEQGRIHIARIKNGLAGTLGVPDMTEVRAAAADYVELMVQHITTENTDVFPMADKILDAGSVGKLCENFKKHEREWIGEGKHEEFHTLLETLQDVYLK